MGYESELYVCTLYDFDSGTDGDCGERLRAVIKEAVIDLSKMGYETVKGKRFSDIFDKPLNAPLYVHGEEQTEDCYGKELCYAEIPDVLDWLYHSETFRDYWRARVAAQVLSAYAHENPSLVVVHYGY